MCAETSRQAVDNAHSPVHLWSDSIGWRWNCQWSLDGIRVSGDRRAYRSCTKRVDLAGPSTVIRHLHNLMTLYQRTKIENVLRLVLQKY